jgi:hypothetical protein
MLRIPIKIMALVVCVFPVVLQGSQAPTAGAPAPETQAASLQGARIIRFCSTFLATLWNSRHARDIGPDSA